MKYAFVRFAEEDEEGVSRPSTIIVSGGAAESAELFIESMDGGLPIRVLDWFEVPADWENLVVGGLLNESFEAILGLDALGETPIVSDLLASIFETGYRLALRNKG